MRAAVGGSVCDSVRLSGSVRGSGLRLSSGATVCGSAATLYSISYDIPAVEARLPLPAPRRSQYYIHMLWPAISCNLSLRIISYTDCNKGYPAPSCTMSLTIYISTRGTSLPPPAICRSVLSHIRAVEATQPPPAPCRSQNTSICCGLPSPATRRSVIYHIRRAVEARLPPLIPRRSQYIHGTSLPQYIICGL
jgi:hypothetical protein